jgi:hypothetical protein
MEGGKMDRDYGTDIAITFDFEDIEKKTQDEKLNLLLKIAFDNHKVLGDHGKILFGNGKAGLCDVARTNKMLIKYLIGTVGMAIMAFAGVLYGHLAK